MSDDLKDKLETIFSGIVVVVIIFLTGGGAEKIVNAVIPNETCSDVSIPYETQTVSNPLTTTDSVKTLGQNGLKNVCKTRDGAVTKEEIKTYPVTQVNSHGTYVAPVVRQTPEPVEYVQPQGGGAICNDGSRSYSTGRGTCSWHGGVNYYL